jgi:hypothetical protein
VIHYAVSASSEIVVVPQLNAHEVLNVCHSVDSDPRPVLAPSFGKVLACLRVPAQAMPAMPEFYTEGSLGIIGPQDSLANLQFVAQPCSAYLCCSSRKVSKLTLVLSKLNSRFHGHP